jgi:diguanylate cyclase (GGDEF)-like protein
MGEYERFIGPLPKEIYSEVTMELNLFRQDRAVELAARALYGQKTIRAALEETQKKFEDSTIDKMTGLLRRDPFLEQAQDLLKRLPLSLESKNQGPSVRTTDPDSALFFVFDIINLKEINDKHGHSEGDKAIGAAADFLRRIFRSHDGDIVGRLGGDEFGVLMPFRSQEISSIKLHDVINRRIISIRQKGAGHDSPAVRYDFVPIEKSSREPKIEEILHQADPKKPAAEPFISLPDSSVKL